MICETDRKSQQSPVQSNQNVRNLCSMATLKEIPAGLKNVPKMSQPHFIELWQTLYSMFPCDPEDDGTYRCVAEIGK